MKILADKNNNIILDYEGKYPIEPAFVDLNNVTIKNARLKINGAKAPLLDSLKAAILAFKTVRYGQWIDESSSIINDLKK